MKSLHLTLMIFCQILLAAFIFYSTLAEASQVIIPQHHVKVQPVVHPAVEPAAQPAAVYSPAAEPSPVVTPRKLVVEQVKQYVEPQVELAKAPVEQQVAKQEPVQKSVVVKESVLEAKSDPVSAAVKPVAPAPVAQATPVEPMAQVASVPVPVPVHASEHKGPIVQMPVPVAPVASPPVPIVEPTSAALVSVEPKIESIEPFQDNYQLKKLITDAAKQPVAQQQSESVAVAVGVDQVKSYIEQAVIEKLIEKLPAELADPLAKTSMQEVTGKSDVPPAAVEPVRKVEPVAATVALVAQSPEPKATVVAKVDYPAPVAPVAEEGMKKVAQNPSTVNGGLGPLHLLAATLCSHQPDKQVADETLNALYSQRAAVRRSLFDFMSLKFTNLEKLSSRLYPGLEVVPPKKLSQPGAAGPSHGWPVVGKCTAHDLKLMAEAAWCETEPKPVAVSSSEALDNEAPKITSNKHKNSRSLGEPTVSASGSVAPAIAGDQSAVVSKIVHVSDVKEAPTVESSIQDDQAPMKNLINAYLNLTQQQLVDLQAHATSTRLCRRNALKLTKALFNHLAEDQSSQSESWPQLYAQISEDDCARKRMIDIVNALSGFRTESTTIRRDNVEFAFAMDDLRTKVLESEVNVPLVFDKQFIEVEQFLQQSVKLMLANIDPERAKLTSMRYRSLMPGPVAADDQCIELHQRLLAKNYPTDCNPTQFGQLPDVLRMAASSLELWSIEKELSRYIPKLKHQQQEYQSPAATQVSNVNECIANLVAS